MPRVLIFANPIAGKGKGKAIARLLQTHLNRRGYDVSTFLSKPDPNTCQGLNDVRCAIVIGGDGTLRGVAQQAIETYAGNLDAPSLSPNASCIAYPLLVVPMGTANLMGRHLGVDWTDRDLGPEVVAAVETGEIRYLDVARVQDGTPRGIFLLMAGIGFDAFVVHELDRIRRGPIDMTKYVLPAVKALVDYRFPRLQVTVDDKLVFRSAPALALIGNIPEYGTGFPMLPHARPDDQLLDVCVMPCSTHAELFQIAFDAAMGRHHRSEGVVYLKGKKIRVESPDAAPVQVDGEAAGTAPIDVDLLPARIPFIVPQNSRQ